MALEVLDGTKSLNNWWVNASCWCAKQLRYSTLPSYQKLLQAEEALYPFVAPNGVDRLLSQIFTVRVHSLTQFFQLIAPSYINENSSSFVGKIIYEKQ
ncbi:MAG: hypothetical protein LBH52_02105 [Puniceicoccales bacterium]|jgi:hypothetical protein|nr:hypothetical protein [Puniceicoccales bacterium]